MKDNMRQLGESFIKNRDIIKKVYKLEELSICSAAANILTAASGTAQTVRMAQRKHILIVNFFGSD